MSTMFKNGSTNSRRRIHQHLTVVAGLLFASSGSSFAALPTVAPPPGLQSSSSTDWLLWTRLSFDEGLTIIGLAVATIGMIMVVWKCLKAYSEVGQGRGDWGDVVTAATGGAVVMMMGAAVLTIAAAIF